LYADHYTLSDLIFKAGPSKAAALPAPGGFAHLTATAKSAFLRGIRSRDATWAAIQIRLTAMRLTVIELWHTRADNGTQNRWIVHAKGIPPQ
jgi:hypothetical protein